MMHQFTKMQVIKSGMKIFINCIKNIVMEDSKMKKHVTVVGAIHIGFGILGLIGAVAVFFALNFARGFVENEEIPTMVLNFLSVSLPLLIGFMSTLGLVGE